MKYSRITGVYVTNYSQPSTLPNNPTCLCLEHQETEIPQAPFTFPINALQAYYTHARCAICGQYLGLPEDHTPEHRLTQPDDLPRERVATLPEYEMRALIAVLKKAADHFGNHICDDLRLTPLVPSMAQRREMLHRYHIWNGDPEVYEEDQAAGGPYAEYPLWTYSAILDYFAYRLAPDLEQEFREGALQKTDAETGVFIRGRC